ncbi:hypothetical protein C4K03_1436 [Pseudomonas synxantha]|uniref:Uncharacterized protein n=1 Tax=Pseudomonas synxantha TaxID=47883 RepID=A0A3G7U2Q6_9PSED|nr:hypothetical protein C4K03_1436 [Pseudomonas synxantha]
MGQAVGWLLIDPRALIHMLMQTPAAQLERLRLFPRLRNA